MRKHRALRHQHQEFPGPTFAQKRLTVEVLDQFTERLHRYRLLKLLKLLTLGLVGVSVGLPFAAVGRQVKAKVHKAKAKQAGQASKAAAKEAVKQGCIRRCQDRRTAEVQPPACA